MQITDKPAFEWRGLMLDSSRHFLSKDFLLACLDIMPALRFNRLHLHFNDDHGWRMQSKIHPELTRTGAFVLDEPTQRGFYSKDA